jgi:hypothetical protein
MPSLEENLKQLEQDVVAQPMRIAAHSDMPFAIFRYDPHDEFLLRKHVRLLAYSLQQNHRREPFFVSIAALVWEIVRKCQGTDYLFTTEKVRGIRSAQEHIARLLASPDYRPIGQELITRIVSLVPSRHILFLVRAGGFAPFIYRCSDLLDHLHHHTMVPTILFYPGTAETGTDLRFYNLPIEGGLGVYNYRVRVYGVEK